ncbi:MAG: hypothetical protein EPO21_12455 [Chloroflexota bacterium]|nr:MAG: hypothetical protein EPO21_12455 [Chloroflexota bacterium]
MYNSIDQLIEQDFLVETESVLRLADPVFAVWLNVEPDRRDPLAAIGNEEGYHLVLGPPTTVESVSVNRDEAVADGQAQAAQVIESAPAAFRDGLYRDRTLRVQAGETEVDVLRPVVPAVLAGGLIGLTAAAVAAVRRHRNRRITCDSDQSSQKVQRRG